MDLKAPNLWGRVLEGDGNNRFTFNVDHPNRA